MLLNDSDPLWMKFRHMHIAELLTTIHAEYKEFLEKHKESAALGKAGQDVKTMAEGLRGMPKFQEQTARYSLHIHVGGELVAKCAAQFAAQFGAQFGAIRRSALTRRAAPLQDPKAMAGMMKSATGKEMSEEQIAQVQSMMSNMSEEDMMKWSGRMQRLAGWAQKPVAAYRAAAAAVDRVPGGLLTVLCAVSGVLLVGHFTEWY